jgi:hypothetical protein
MEGEQAPPPGTQGERGAPSANSNEMSLGQQPASSGEKVSDEKIASIAAAHREVMPIQQKLHSDLRNAAGAEEARQLQEAAKKRVLTILRRHNLTLQSYQVFFNRLRRDADLRTRFRKALQQPTEKKQKEGPRGGFIR